MRFLLVTEKNVPQRSTLLVPAVCLCALLSLGTAMAQNSLNAPPPSKLRDQKLELAMKINEPFDLVAVGDMLQMVPVSKNNDPNIQALMKIMRAADITLANNENTIVNTTTFTGQISHMETPAVVADDWANMGIKMVTKANNHTWDDGDEGLLADFQELDRVGIVHAGVDRTLADARLARYAATPKGTVGMVGIYAENDRSVMLGMAASRVVTVTPDQLLQLRAIRDSIVARRGEVENPIVIPPEDPKGQTDIWGVAFRTGTPTTADDAEANEWTKKAADRARRLQTVTTKINNLELVTYNGVTAVQMAQLRAIAGDTGQGDKLAAFGLNFMITPKPGEFHYEMRPQSERDILREIRTGKQFSDFEAVQIHWHQNRYAFQHYSFDHYPADYEIQFAHDAVDQGADAFIGHGVHTIKGVEIYKGKPIFYGVSNFVLQEQMFPTWRDKGSEPPTPLTGPIVGEGEKNESAWAWMERPDNYQALLADMHYEHGLLTEVRIYPVDLGLTFRPGSQLGTPKRPAPEVAKQILERVIEYSKPFGTKIDIVNGVGIIHLLKLSK